MKARRLVAFVTGVLVIAAGTADAQSELWRCRQADGSIKFSDHGGLGCRRGEYQKDIQRIESPQPPVSLDQAPAIIPQPSLSPQPAPGSGAPSLVSHPFPPAVRSVPSLAVRDLSPQLKAKGFSLPNKGDITIVQLTISHLPAGNGPQVGADSHFQPTSQMALATAVMAAAKATQYDQRFLSVQLSMPAAVMFDHGQQIDGPSAGVAWAVAITSALLGDPLRSDVCLSGTINMDLAVGPVGGLEHKIEGCHMLRTFRELILPRGQNTFTITDKGMARSIKVTEVSTLAEAYQAATGQMLRPMQ